MEEDYGVHRLVATYPDGRTERVPCACGLCEAARAIWPQLRDRLRSVEPERRPDWLPTSRGEADPRAETDPYGDVRRIAAQIGGYAS